MLVKEKIKSDRLILKNITREEVGERYLQWLYDPKVNQFLEVRHNLPNLEELRNYVDKINSTDNDLFLGIFLLNGLHIGNIRLGPIDTEVFSSALGIMIGDRSQWGFGYAAEAIEALTSYTFDYLNLSIIWAACYDINMGSYKAFLKAGYFEAARKKKECSFNDTFVNTVILKKIKKEGYRV